MSKTIVLSENKIKVATYTDEIIPMVGDIITFNDTIYYKILLRTFISYKNIVSLLVETVQI